LVCLADGCGWCFDDNCGVVSRGQKIKDGLTGFVKIGKLFFGAVAVALLSFAIICMLHIFAMP